MTSLMQCISNSKTGNYFFKDIHHYPGTTPLTRFLFNMSKGGSRNLYFKIYTKWFCCRLSKDSAWRNTWLDSNSGFLLLVSLLAGQSFLKGNYVVKKKEKERKVARNCAWLYSIQCPPPLKCGIFWVFMFSWGFHSYVTFIKLCSLKI